jgi:hypothetical protein
VLYTSFRRLHQATLIRGSPFQRRADSFNEGAGVLATAARIGILVLSTAIALRQMGIANEIIELAFGLGGRDVGRQADRAVAQQRQECLAALG